MVRLINAENLKKKKSLELMYEAIDEANTYDLFDAICASLPNVFDKSTKEPDDDFFRFATNGDEILFKRRYECEIIADLLIAIGIDGIHTGYYDPEEDIKSEEVDENTGYYYINVD